MPKSGGEIAAEFALLDGRTHLVRKYHSSPLKIAKTFRFENEPHLQLAGMAAQDQLGVYMMDCSPGLMSGDTYELSWHLHKGASVFLTNQSFTKVHPSEGEGSRQLQRIQVDAHALLEYMPEPIMLYKDASFHGETEIHLASEATLMMSEILCPGRVQRGEKFHYKSYINRMRVYHEGELIYCQHQNIDPSRIKLNAPGCWEGQTHLGSLFVFSDSIRQKHVDAVLEALTSQDPIDNEPANSYHNLGALPVRFGASLTYKHGMVFTVMGTHAWQLQHTISAAWQAIRSSLLCLAPLVVHK
jgi:urease accessory protein